VMGYDRRCEQELHGDNTQWPTSTRPVPRQQQELLVFSCPNNLAEVIQIKQGAFEKASMAN